MTSVWFDNSAISLLLLSTVCGGLFSGARQFVAALSLGLCFAVSLTALVAIELIVGHADMMDRRYVIFACLVTGLFAGFPVSKQLHHRIRHIGFLRRRSFSAACGFVSGTTLVLIGTMFVLFFQQSLRPAVLDKE